MSGLIYYSDITINIYSALIGLFRRYRLLPRLKAHLTNTPYEDIVITDTKQATIRQSSQTTVA